MVVPRDRKDDVLERGQRRVRVAHGRSAHRPDLDDGSGHQRRAARPVRALRRSRRGARRQGRAAAASRPAGLDQGYYFEPTVLDLPDNAQPGGAGGDLRSGDRRAVGYDDLDDAVRIANDSVYGLSAQVYGADVAAATNVARRLAHRRGQREHRACSAPTRRAAATSRAASAASAGPTASAPSKRSSTWRSESCK